MYFSVVVHHAVIPPRDGIARGEVGIGSDSLCTTEMGLQDGANEWGIPCQYSETSRESCAVENLWRDWGENGQTAGSLMPREARARSRRSPYVGRRNLVYLLGCVGGGA